MKALDALSEFNGFATKHGKAIERLTPEDATTLMIDFYRDVRAEDCSLEEDGDMLLFQWGVYDWGQGESFEYNITRQFIFPERGEDEDGAWEEDAMWQLSLTLKYPTSSALRNLAAGNRWCSSLAEAGDFAAFVEQCEATRAIKGQKAKLVTLEYNQV